MIATFFDNLFAYADMVKEEKGVESEAYQTVQFIEDMLQKVYDDHTRLARSVTDFKPQTKEQILVFRAGHIEVFEDKDGYYYEMDGRHFDTLTEIFDAVIEDRESNYRKNKRYLAQIYKDDIENILSEAKNNLDKIISKNKKMIDF